MVTNLLDSKQTDRRCMFVPSTAVLPAQRTYNLVSEEVPAAAETTQVVLATIPSAVSHPCPRPCHNRHHTKRQDTGTSDTADRRQTDGKARNMRVRNKRKRYYSTGVLRYTKRPYHHSRRDKSRLTALQCKPRCVAWMKASWGRTVKSCLRSSDSPKHTRVYILKVFNNKQQRKRCHAFVVLPVPGLQERQSIHYSQRYKGRGKGNAEPLQRAPRGQRLVLEFTSCLLFTFHRYTYPS